MGKPIVNYRESLLDTVPFEYLHRKQTGGAGQYAKMIGLMRPLYDINNKNQDIFENHFKNEIVGTSISSEYITAIEKQFYYNCEKGPLAGYPIINT